MPTIKDIALACGVSTATVSQVLHNGRRPVHPLTRERVIQVARALDYYPNAVAQGLARKRMNTIGLVFLHHENAEQTNPYLIMILNGVLNVSARRRQNTMLFTVKDWEAAENLPEIGSGRCDGVLLLVPPTVCALPERLQRRKVPFVIVNAPSDLQDVSSVDTDNIAAARTMTEHLLQLGHRRIAFVRGAYDLQFSFVHERHEGYRQAMMAAGVYDLARGNSEYEDAVTFNSSVSGGPTAFFCCHDAGALKLMENYQRRGIRVPEDVSIVGFDDISEARASQPSLTTMRQPAAQIGEDAAEKLLSLLDGSTEPSHREVLSAELIVRQSSAPPRAGA